MTQRELDIRRRRLTAVLALVGVILGAYGVIASIGWMAPDLLPPVAKATTGSRRVASAAHALATSSLLRFTPSRSSTAVARLVRARKPLFCGGTKPYVALTFDDGPSGTTPKLVKLLRDSGVSATFFVVGSRLNDDRSSVRDMLSVGEIANHSWNHPQYTRMKGKEIGFEVRTTNDLIRAVQGRGTRYARPPYGARDDRVTKELAQLGMVEVLWSADTEDAMGADWRRVADYATQGIGPGAIVLMHDGREATLKALRTRVLPAARRRKLHFVTLSELLAVNPPSAAQIEAGPRGCAHAGERNVTGLFSQPSEQFGYQP